MKIALLSFQFEANTFVNAKTYYNDFDIYRGEEMLSLIPCMDVFQQDDIQYVPVLYANGVPGPVVDKEAYLRILNEILEKIPEDSDGIWIYVHGSMHVEGIGSGEAYMSKKIREKLGDKVLISLAMDFHANNDIELMRNANIMCAYRTAPHCDQAETQRRAAQLLIHCLKEGLCPKPVFAKIPITAPGEWIMTAYEPVRPIIEELKKLDECTDIINASFFAGHAWVDTKNNGASVVVTPYKDIKKAEEICRNIAMMYWNNREKIGFRDPAMSPEESLDAAKKATKYPVFISDTGDNATAGPVADNGWFLKKIQKSDLDSVLIAAITDKPAVDKCMKLNIGDTVNLTVGASIDPTGEKTEISGVLAKKSTVPSWSSEEGCASVLIKCGKIDVILTEIAIPFISKEVFDRAGVNIKDYKVIVVKSGYLFDKIARHAASSIMAITPGTAYIDITKLEYKNIPRPMYPIDKSFEFNFELYK
ncbi:MAG: M81 family metallopeptidase [Acetivibrionales bacterium]|jgi:microcystin degradation protein MlrC